MDVVFRGLEVMPFVPVTPFEAVADTLAPHVSSWWRLLAFVSAFLSSVVAAPLIARLAMKFKVVDAPDGNRKLQRRPIPLTGGPTILVSLMIGVGLTLWMFPTLLLETKGDISFLIGLFVSGGIIVAVGLIDDRFGIRGRQKLLAQFVAALVMLPAGMVIEKVSIFGFEPDFGDLAPLIGGALTVLFIVGAINALNLIDGVDGMASTTGIVLSFSVAAVSVISAGRPDGLMISLVLAGALCGFLIFDFPPARMFLGDSGSMLIGLVLGAVALKCSMKSYTTVALVMPAAIWAIPLFDAFMAVLRRKLTGRSIYGTDRGHLHHCLERKGLGGGKLLATTAALCALTGLGAIVASTLGTDQWLGKAGSGSDLIAVVGVLTAISLLVITRSFGHTEISLLTSRMRRLTSTMMQRINHDTAVLHDEKVRLHGDQNWQSLWEMLVAFAERFEMDSVEFGVNLPRIGEEYHASWKRRNKTEAHEEWKSEIPLIVEGMRVGYIRVVGAVGEGSICKWMSELIGGLQSFEDELVQLIQDLGRDHAVEGKVEPVLRPARSVLSDSEQFIMPQGSV